MYVNEQLRLQPVQQHAQCNQPFDGRLHFAQSLQPRLAGGDHAVGSSLKYVADYQTLTAVLSSTVVMEGCDHIAFIQAFPGLRPCAFMEWQSSWAATHGNHT